MVKDTHANAGDIRDMGLIHGLERSPGGQHGNPLNSNKDFHGYLVSP